MTFAELRAEGVVEICRVGSMLAVLTHSGVRLFHVNDVQDRILEERALKRAIAMFESGFNENDVSAAIGVNPDYLRRTLKAAGYERQSLEGTGPRKGADARRRRPDA